MMRFLGIGTLLCVAVGVLGQEQPRAFQLQCSGKAATLRPLNKDISFHQYPDAGKWVNAEGTWRLKASSAKFTRLAVINSVSIDCYDRTRLCTERIALVHSKQDLVSREQLALTPLHQENLLDVMVNEYRIVEWTPTLIRATVSLPVADVEIQISASRKTASRLYREKASKTDFPISNSYVLE